jgi:hypothetical protein
VSRKVFDDAKGKHVDKQVTLPVDEVLMPVEWLLVECSVCNAKPYEPCKRIEGKRGDEKKLPHAARWEAAKGAA